MWKWKKDFFYFSKGDRIAIILLLNLIIISGSILIYMNKFSFTDSVYQNRNNEVQQNFIQFEKDMKQIVTIEEAVAEDDKGTISTNKSKINKQKLELGQTIDINTASTTILTRIPGIGNTFAERIIEYRDSLGGFASLEQLYEIKGITVNKFSKILPYLILQKKHKLIRVNSATMDQIIGHPYLDEKQQWAIVESRKDQKIRDISHLLDNESFSSRDIDRLTPYLSFD